MSIVFAAAIAHAQTQSPAPTPTPTPVNVTAKWQMTLEMEVGTSTPTLVLKQDGEKITGTYAGRYGEYALTGTLKARAIAFTFTMGSETEPITLNFTGEVAADGESMKGKAQMGDMGEASWTARRVKTL